MTTERRAERADAARNRRAILRAADELLRRHDPGQVSIEQVAAAAGVGKGTVFHRFGSRVGLMRALIEERAAVLSEAIATGPPPLGPGAPPRDRLAAFFDALVDLGATNIALIAAHDHARATHRPVAGRRETNPVYLCWHGHIAALIAQARPDLDAELPAHILLGSMHNEQVAEFLRQGQSARLAAALRELAAALLGPCDEEARARNR